MGYRLIWVDLSRNVQIFGHLAGIWQVWQFIGTIFVFYLSPPTEARSPNQPLLCTWYTTLGMSGYYAQIGALIHRRGWLGWA